MRPTATSITQATITITGLSSTCTSTHKCYKCLQIPWKPKVKGPKKCVKNCFYCLKSLSAGRRHSQHQDSLMQKSEEKSTTWLEIPGQTFIK